MSTEPNSNTLYFYVVFNIAGICGAATTIAQTGGSDLNIVGAHQFLCQKCKYPVIIEKWQRINEASHKAWTAWLASLDTAPKKPELKAIEGGGEKLPGAKEGILRIVRTELTHKEP